MRYFTTEFIDFFEELTKNNTKQWFNANRKRYEKYVKQPFQDFVEEMISRIRADDPAVDISSRDAIFRINRDIRFSKNKTLYKTHVSAMISPGGRKNKCIPGNYIQLDTEFVRFYGGAHFLEKEHLHKVRAAMARDLDAFSNLINEPEFVKKFGQIHGEQHKRLPAEFKEAQEKLPLMANKQFYFFAKLDARKYLTDDNLVDTLMDYYYTSKPIIHFFRKALFNQD